MRHLKIVVEIFKNNTTASPWAYLHTQQQKIITISISIIVGIIINNNETKFKKKKKKHQQHHQHLAIAIFYCGSNKLVRHQHLAEQQKQLFFLAELNDEVNRIFFRFFLVSKILFTLTTFIFGQIENTILYIVYKNPYI